MAEAQEMSTEEFVAQYTKDIETGPRPAATDSKPPTFEEFSKDRAEGKITGHEPEPVAPTPPRDERGRFASVRDRLARMERKDSYLQAMDRGAVDPSDDMSPEEWSRARAAQIRNNSAGINPPVVPDDKPADGAEGEEAEPELTPEQIKHNEAHEELHTRLLAKLEAPEVKQLTKAMEYAVERGATPYFFDTIGNLAADLENSEAVLYHLGENPDKLAAFSFLTPDKLKSVIRTLSQQLGAQQKPAEPKPKPPNPVGARASAKAFDVNDESTDIDTWRRQREKQLYGRERR
jgi:hypothetical protein